jgi:hypothetical protein
MSAYRYAITVDEARNVLHLAQAGHAEEDDLRRMQADYAAALSRMRPEFVLVSDQLEVESFSDQALEVGKALVALTAASRVAKVIRVMPAGLIARTRISRVLVSAAVQYVTVRVSTREEAEHALAEHLREAAAAE